MPSARRIERTQSTVGVAEATGVACAGPLLAAELDALGRVLDDPARPLVAVVGGAKVSTKLAVLETLDRRCGRDHRRRRHCQYLPGWAGGVAIGASLAEPDQVDVARRIMARLDVPMPVDVMTATAVDAAQPARLRLRHEVGSDEMILDIGPETGRRLAEILANAGTILWNGPVGVFELDQFGEGTRVLADAIAGSDAYSLAGGGDTLAAIDKYGVGGGVSYRSTGGGAFLEYLAGQTLPGVAVLEGRIR